jgi:hypothetical protein
MGYMMFGLFLMVSFFCILSLIERGISNDDELEEVEAQIKAQEEAEERQWEEARKLRRERKRREQDLQDKRQEEVMKRAFLQAMREYDEEQNGAMAVPKANSSPSETSPSDRERIVSVRFSGNKTS